MTTSLFDLHGKTALVTGGATGIGRECALALGMAGASVAIAGRREELGRETIAALRRKGCDAIFVRCDVTQAEQVAAMVATVARHFGRLDIAVNNAGTFRGGRDEEQSEADWAHVVGINLTGAWLCAQAEMKQMIRQTPTEGKIINIASIMAHLGHSNAAYDASKAGLIRMTKTLAAQWGRYNINVNSISPGYVIESLGITRSETEQQWLRSATPLGYAQTLADLRGPVVFLASKASDYITGQDIIVDGGYTLSKPIMMRPFERDVPPRVSPAREFPGEE
jgi:NAD(P)-dependent dehydrogenase (short-subunit alcohol dehydrogenase family)